jgi:glutamate dehydrogenase
VAATPVRKNSSVLPPSIFASATQRSPRQPVLALYTPDFDRHGWHSPHTVIDVVTDDMPFLVDSISMLVYRRGLAIHRLLHPLLSAERGPDGTACSGSLRMAGRAAAESWIHLEIDRIGDSGEVDDLQREIAGVLADVRSAVEDGAAIQQNMRAAAAELAADAEAADYLSWIAANNFVFLGYAEYFVGPVGSA